MAELDDILTGATAPAKQQTLLYLVDAEKLDGPGGCNGISEVVCLENLPSDSELRRKVEAHDVYWNARFAEDVRRLNGESDI